MSVGVEEGGFVTAVGGLEVFEQNLYVVKACAQGRHIDAELIETPVKIGAEQAVFAHCRQIAICCGDDPEAETIAAGFGCGSVQKFQQGLLHGHGEVCDFI